MTPSGCPLDFCVSEAGLEPLVLLLPSRAGTTGLCQRMEPFWVPFPRALLPVTEAFGAVLII